MILGLAILGPVLTSQAQHDELLTTFLSLCEDKVWAVRKACADVLPDMAQLATADMRKAQLLPVFDKLCQDVSHWVQNAALQQLGTFISTLAAPIPDSEHLILLLPIFQPHITLLPSSHPPRPLSPPLPCLQIPIVPPKAASLPRQMHEHAAV